MKNWLYEIIADFGESFIVGCQFLAELLINLLTEIVNKFIELTASIFKLALWLIDGNRVSHAEHVIDQMSINNELSILMNVTKIKEDALERRAWTTHHSIALNELSSQLYNECNWDRVRIHDYMRAIVESIPGLTYAAVDDDDEDEDEAIDLDD